MQGDWTHCQPSRHDDQHAECHDLINFGVYCILVGGLEPWEFYDFPETVGNVIIPTDELHHFSEG